MNPKAKSKLPQECKDLVKGDKDAEMRCEMIEYSLDDKLKDQKSPHIYKKAYTKFEKSESDYCKEKNITFEYYHEFLVAAKKQGYSPSAIKDYPGPDVAGGQPEKSAESSPFPDSSSTENKKKKPPLSEEKPNVSTSTIRKEEKENAKPLPPCVGENAASPIKEKKKSGSDRDDVENKLNEIMVDLKKQQTSLLDKYSTKIMTDFDTKHRGMDSKLKAMMSTVAAWNRAETQVGDRYKDLSGQLKSFSDQLRIMDERQSELLEIRQDTEPVLRRIKEIENTLDTLMGRFVIIEEINDILKEKSVTLRKTFPPANEEDEVIEHLSEYGLKILDQLTIAARHYARNRESITHAGLDKHRKELEQGRQEERDIGRKEGGRLWLEDLIGKFNDLDGLFESRHPNDQVLTSFLRNKGLSLHEELSRGKSVTITLDNRSKYEHLASFDGTGEYRVIESCFVIEKMPVKLAVLQNCESDTGDINGSAEKTDPEGEKEQG